MLCQTRLLPLEGSAHAVQIKVKGLGSLLAARNWIRLTQRVGWTFDLTGIAHALNQVARKGRLACA